MSPKSSRRGADDEPIGDNGDDATRYKLTLYVSGASPKSLRAVENVKMICEKHIPGHYDLAIIDIYQHPEVAVSENLLAAPTLIKTLPMPIRKLLGDMSDEERVLAGLSIEPQKP